MFYGIYAAYGGSEGVEEKKRTSALHVSLYFYVEDQVCEKCLARVGGKKAQIPLICDDLRRDVGSGSSGPHY